MINSNQYYISGENNNGPLFLFFDVMYDWNGVLNYTFRPVSPGETGKIDLPDDAANILFRVFVYKDRSTFKQIFQQFFWGPVTKCFVVSGPYESVQMEFVPCITNPSCCCCCQCCSPCCITSPCCSTSCC